MADQRRTLDLDDNVQYDLVMKFTSPLKEGTNDFGPWYLWTVEEGGEDVSMFAKEDLQMLLEAAELEKGDKVSIKAVKTGKQRRTWHVWCNDQAVSLKDQQQAPQQEQQQEPRQEQQQAPRREQQQEPRQEAPKRGDMTYADRVNLLGACIQDAALIWAAAQTEGDSSRAIAAIANTLFIDCRKDRSLRAPDYSEPDTSGVTSDPEIHEGDPGYGEPPPDQDDEDLPF